MSNTPQAVHRNCKMFENIYCMSIMKDFLSTGFKNKVLGQVNGEKYIKLLHFGFLNSLRQYKHMEPYSFPLAPETI